MRGATATERKKALRKYQRKGDADIQQRRLEWQQRLLSKRAQGLEVKSKAARRREKLKQRAEVIQQRGAIKTGHSETDAKARSLRDRREELRIARETIEKAELAKLTEEERALRRFRETSQHLRSFRSEQRIKDSVQEGNLRLLLISESLAKKDRVRSKVAKGLLGITAEDEGNDDFEEEDLDQYL